MKARNKKTGEVVTNFGISKEYGTASYIDSTNTLRFSTPLDGEWEIIDESEPIDLSSFRREAAKDAMCQLIGMGRDDGYKYSPEEVVRYAIVYADELIRQLKQE